MLPYYTSEQVHAALAWEPLLSALRTGFLQGATVPLRHAHAVSATDALLLMPAWNPQALGVKVVTVMPASHQPTVQATYLLLNRHTGVPLAILDGEALTLRRTAATSVLASLAMARHDATTLLVIGTGTLAPFMVRAYCALRPSLTRVLIWGRNAARANMIEQQLHHDEGLPIEMATSLPDAVAAADIVCTATTARAPVVCGAWLSPGTHLDVVGGYTPSMREVDDDAVRQSRIVVDSMDGALQEAGDLVDPLARGIIRHDAIVAELAAVLRGDIAGRTNNQQITMFKSVGLALEDLVAATLVHQSKGVSA